MIDVRRSCLCLAGLTSGLLFFTAPVSATSTAGSDLVLTVTLSSAEFSTGSGAGLPAEPFLDYEFEPEGLYTSTSDAFSTAGTGSATQTDSLQVDGVAPDSEGYFPYDPLIDSLELSLTSAASASGAGSLYDSNAGGIVELYVNNFTEEEILFVFDFSWQRNLSLTNTVAGDDTVAFIDAIATSENDLFAEENHFIDGNSGTPIIGSNIGNSVPGTVMLEGGDDGQIFLSVEPLGGPDGTDGFAAFLFDVSIGSRAEVSAVPVPAVVWLFPAGLMAGLGWMRRR